MRGLRAKLPASVLADLSRRKNPYKNSAPYNPEEWIVTLFRRPRRDGDRGLLSLARTPLVPTALDNGERSPRKPLAGAVPEF